MPTDAPSTTDLRAWIVDRVAHYMEREPGDIDPDVPLTAFGIDSVYAFALCGDVEDEFRLPLVPTEVWAARTVNGLAEHVRAALATATAVVS